MDPFQLLFNVLVCCFCFCILIPSYGRFLVSSLDSVLVTLFYNCNVFLFMLLFLVSRDIYVELTFIKKKTDETKTSSSPVQSPENYKRTIITYSFDILQSTAVTDRAYLYFTLSNCFGIFKRISKATKIIQVCLLILFLSSMY